MTLSLTDSPAFSWKFLESYLRRYDVHAARHLELLGEVRSRLEAFDLGRNADRAASFLCDKDVSREGEAAAGSGRLAAAANMAEELERLRYQLLNERAAALGEEDLRATEELDRIYARLVDRRTPDGRRARRLLWNPDFARDAVERLEQSLDPALPLEALTASARRLTEEHFAPESGDRPGKGGRHRVLLYAPLYLSNYCVNGCVYCHFRFDNPMPRIHLSPERAVEEAEYLVARGMRHILLVAGDYPQLTGIDYYVSVVDALRRRFAGQWTVEIAAQSTASYARLAAAGVLGVTLYQETYDLSRYAVLHPRGPKTRFDRRLETLERAAEAGIRRLGLGILLGLAPAAEDARTLVRHALYLRQRFPHCTLAVSLPRLHRPPEGFAVPHPVDDATLVRLYCGLRHALPDAELVLSTRETASLRDYLAGVCVTQLSAGSSTAPGGYGDRAAGRAAAGGEQFPVNDERPVEEAAQALRRQGLAVVWESA
ncbi:MAG: radical SAM protein [Thermogutta sp.]|nr:radical SAM protein [Thermogutta sp.]